METFSFGFPPDGKSALLSNGTKPMPETLQSAIAAQHEADHPHGYITAAVDHELGLVGLYHRTASDWIQIDRVTKIVLQPTLPAKGRGMVEIFWESDLGQSRGGCLYVVGYTERMHAWFAERGQRLAAMIACPYLEADSMTDS